MLDSNTMEVIHIDFPPHRDAQAQLSIDTTAPQPLSDPGKAFAQANRARVPPPRGTCEFLPDLLAEQEGDKFKLRDDVKPLHIIQPEGVSFKVDGNVLEWQKWKMHIGESRERVS